MFKSIKTNKLNKLKSNLFNFAENFHLNDPTTPDLSVSAPLPTLGHLKFMVKGMTTSGTNSNENRARNCFFTSGNCINNAQRFLSSPLKKWAACDVLNIDPVAGPDLNAYYDRKSVKLFYYNFNNKNIYFSDSADVITHELGHAFLDAMRPDFWSVQSLEIWSFHEAFSDILAVFSLMNHDSALEKALNETNCNLLSSNCISRLAEEVGILIRNITRDESYLPNCLRDPAIEKFYYVDPLKLPADTKNNKLAAECHSFGRVFSNAWYNIFVRIFDFHVSNGEDKMSAIRKARDVSFSSLMQAIPVSPRVSNYYSAIANCMVSTAAAKKKEYGDIVKNVFLEWKIIEDSSFKVLSNKKWRDVVSNLKKEDVVLKNKNNTLVSIKNNAIFSVKELPLVSNLSVKEDFNVEVAYDSFYQFDKKGNLYAEISSNEEELKSSVALCVMNIGDSIGKGKMWEVKDGLLVRNFI